MPQEFADFNLIRTALILSGVCIAVVTDVRARRIPNALTLALAVAGLGLGMSSQGVPGLRMAIAGCLAGTLFFLVPIAKFGWGMGDLKLVAALGAIGGPVFAVWVGLYSLAAGSVMVVLWLVWQGHFARVATGLGGSVRTGRIVLSGLAIPFAVPIATGVALALLVSPGLPT
jgi:prepilin peptidase CpaA